MAKTWLITGAGSGFGRQLTELLLERGDRVAATVRKPDALQDLTARHGSKLWIAILDVSDSKAVHSVIDRAFLELGRIEVVISNAGYGLSGAAEELTDEQIERQIDTNLIGSMQVARASIPHLRKQGGGRIIQLSSFLGQTGMPTTGVYGATKWAIEGFLEGLIPEVAAFGIEVTLVEPGTARTNFFAGVEMVQHSAVYDDTGVGEFRRKMKAAGPSARRGDARKIASAIIASADQTPAPRRLVLGSDAFVAIHKALNARLQDLEAQKELAFSTDAFENA
jgi:NAD(P)-dependent dehydrogenase (short-subunit alcohol dehydrogenase family)